MYSFHSKQASPISSLGYDCNAHDIYTSLFSLSLFSDKINMTKMHVNVNARSRRGGTLQGSDGRLLVILLEVA